MGDIEILVQRVKKKRELSGIDDAVVREKIIKYFEKNKLPEEKMNDSQLKIVVKDVRSALRENVGMFQASTKNRYNFLEKNDIISLLKTHSSTKERIDFYPKIEEILKKLKINSILDLGCGINPIALAKPGMKYYASDINSDDLNLVKLFFKKMKIDGATFVCDLNKIENCNLPEAELTLIFKVFDIIGKKDYEIAKNVLENLKSKHLIISFSTKTLSGKPMNSPRRIWFEKLLDSLCYKFEIVSSSNELFYII